MLGVCSLCQRSPAAQLSMSPSHLCHLADTMWKASSHRDIFSISLSAEVLGEVEDRGEDNPQFVWFTYAVEISLSDFKGVCQLSSILFLVSPVVVLRPPHTVTHLLVEIYIS